LCARAQQKVKTERKPKSDDAFDVKKEAYLTSVKAHKSHKTWLAYSWAPREFYTACQCLTVGEITKKTLEYFVVALKAKKLSARSISNILDNVVHFFKAQRITDVTLKHKHVQKTSGLIANMKSGRFSRSA
jgi:hypothetical protein